MVKNITGIYRIQSKSQPNKFYIGGSVNVIGRFRSHKSRLKKGTHWSYKMQAHYNEFGFLDFEFIILCECDKEQLIQFEQYFIDFYNPYFNTHMIADSAIGVKRRLEVRLKYSQWQKGIKRGPMKENVRMILLKANTGRKITEETRQKMRDSHKGIKQSEESIKKRVDKIKGLKLGPIPLERRLRISESLKGNIPWNKGLKYKNKKYERKSA